MDKKKKDNAQRGVFRHESGKWAIRYTCGLGHIHEEKIGRDKTQATDAHAARRLRVRDEPSWCPRVERQEVREEAERQAAQQITLKEYARRWLAVNGPHWRPITAEKYKRALENHIYPTLGNIALQDVTREMVRDLLATKRAGGLKINTLNNAIVTPLRAMFNHAVDDGKVAANPATRHMRHIRKTTPGDARKADFLTDREMSVLLAKADKHYPQHADFFHVLAGTGLREGESCGLQWGDFDFHGGFLMVNRSVIYRPDPKQRGNKKIKRPDRKPILHIGAPKSGESGRVDIGPKLSSRLQARRDVMAAEAAMNSREPSPWVFPALGDPTKPLNAKSLQNAWTRLLTLAGLRHIRIHDVRHSYASSLLQAGESIQYVKQQLRHSTIKLTVDLYGHLIPSANRAAIAKLEERISMVPVMAGQQAA